jgi:nitrate/TMAO reductase-like tetraheme cytochrome c subunit
MIATWWTDATTRHRRREAARLTPTEASCIGCREMRGNPYAGSSARSTHEPKRRAPNGAATATITTTRISTDFTRQSPRAQNMHATFVALHEKTCIDSHKGIVYRLPDLGLLANP